LGPRLLPLPRPAFATPPAGRSSRTPTLVSRRSIPLPPLFGSSCLRLVFPARFLDSSSTLAAWRLPHERGFRWSFPGLTISICRPEGRGAELIRTAESRRCAGAGVSAASFILRPYIRPLFISLSLSSVALAGWPLHEPTTLSPLQPPLVFIFSTCFSSPSSLSLSLSLSLVSLLWNGARWKIGCSGVAAAADQEGTTRRAHAEDEGGSRGDSKISSGCFDIVEIVGRC